MNKRKLDSLLDIFEEFASQGWSHPYSCRQMGLKYIKSSFIRRVLNNNIRYRLIIMKHYPDALNIMKWVKEFNDLPDNHRFRLEPDYIDAIKRHSQHERTKRTSSIDSNGVYNPSRPRVERKLCETRAKDPIKCDSNYENSKVKSSLPVGMQRLFKNQSSNRIREGL